MAGLSAKAIKTRIKSMESTRQITKAMELVAASKLRSAQQRALATRPYFHALYDAMQDIAASSASFSSPFLKTVHADKKLYVVIAGDRGLAGGYNNNILKLAYEAMDSNAVVLPIGKRCVEFFRKRNVEILTDIYNIAENITLDSCHSIAELLSSLYLKKSFSAVNLVYTNFTSLLTQSPEILSLLPLKLSAPKQNKVRQDMLYESGSETVFNAIVPAYLGGVIYGAICESTASEQAARRTAMDAATKNADQIISDLNLSYNRARQGAITQEITEIIAGAEQL